MLLISAVIQDNIQTCYSALVVVYSLTINAMLSMYPENIDNSQLFTILDSKMIHYTGRLVHNLSFGGKLKLVTCCYLNIALIACMCDLWPLLIAITNSN